MKRAILYMRVSSVDQHPETQLHDLRQMAAQRGYQIVHEYTDRISGVKARRPGLDELMRDARRGKFDVVLVWACDRIARSTRHLLEVLDEFNRLNIEFISFRESIDKPANSPALGGNDEFSNYENRAGAQGAGACDCACSLRTCRLRTIPSRVIQ